MSGKDLKFDPDMTENIRRYAAKTWQLTDKA